MAILFDWYENPKTSEQQGEENMLHPRLRLNGKGDKERRVYFDAKAKVHLMEYIESRKDKNPVH